jgi:cobalamin biosynthesis protein CbiD
MVTVAWIHAPVDTAYKGDTKGTAPAAAAAAAAAAVVQLHIGKTVQVSLRMSLHWKRSYLQ